MLNNLKSLRVSKIRFDLRLTLVKMRSFIFNVFLNPALVPKSCNPNIFFSFFFLFFLLLMCIEMLHVFQTVESIPETGFLWNTKTNIQGI